MKMNCHKRERSCFLRFSPYIFVIFLFFLTKHISYYSILETLEFNLVIRLFQFYFSLWVCVLYSDYLFPCLLQWRSLLVWKNYTKNEWKFRYDNFLLGGIWIQKTSLTTLLNHLYFIDRLPFELGPLASKPTDLSTRERYITHLNRSI